MEDNKAQECFGSARDKEEKLGYFLTGMSFAFLGAAIETYQPCNCLWIKVPEVISWGLLLLSGVSGIMLLYYDYRTLQEAGFYWMAESKEEEERIERFSKMNLFLSRRMKLTKIRTVTFGTGITVLMLLRALIALS